MSTEQKQDINARLEKILADVRDAIDDAITGARAAPDPIAKTQVLSEGYAKILRLMLPSAAVDGLHLPNPDDVPAHVEHLAPRVAAETVPRDGSFQAIKNGTDVFKAKDEARIAHTRHLGVDQFLVVTPNVGVNEIVIAEDKHVIFEGVSYVGMAKAWKMGKAAFRQYQLSRFHAIRLRRNRAAAAAPVSAAAAPVSAAAAPVSAVAAPVSAAAAPVSAAPRGAEAAETLARPINPEDDE